MFKHPPPPAGGGKSRGPSGRGLMLFKMCTKSRESRILPSPKHPYGRWLQIAAFRRSVHWSSDGSHFSLFPALFCLRWTLCFVWYCSRYRCMSQQQANRRYRSLTEYVQCAPSHIGSEINIPICLAVGEHKQSYIGIMCIVQTVRYVKMFNVLYYL